MRWKAGTDAAILLLLGAAGCETSAGPTAPGAIEGLPNATALENLDLVIKLEREARKTTVFVGVGGFAQLDGRIATEDSWAYSLIDARPNVDQAYVWTVTGTGQVKLMGPSLPIFRADVVDIAASLRVDSRDAVRLADEHGASAYTAKHPNAVVRVAYRRWGGAAICHLHYLDNSVGRDGCEIDIYLRATTGELMARDLSCLAAPPS